MRVGDIAVEPVFDGAAHLPATQAVPGTTENDWLPYHRFLDSGGRLPIELGGLLIRSGGRLVLVDAGVGPATVGPFTGGKLLDSLAAHGAEADAITDVVFTHLHFDHVGWASLDGRAVFANATYHCSAQDWDHFVGLDAHVTAKLEPLQDRIETWDADGPLLPGIGSRAAPGHTPGSTVLELSSGTQRAG